jgi:hypothetical protein
MPQITLQTKTEILGENIEELSGGQQLLKTANLTIQKLVTRVLIQYNIDTQFQILIHVNIPFYFTL